MILLEFEEGPTLESEAPIRLRIGEDEILGWDEETAFMRLPLIPTAFEGLVVLRQLRRHGRFEMQIGRFGANGTLLFALIGEDVVVHDPDSERTGRVPLAELEAAWEAFADRVAAAVRARAPDLIETLERLEVWRTETPPWWDDPRYYEGHWRERFEYYGWWPETID